MLQTTDTKGAYPMAQKTVRYFRAWDSDRELPLTRQQVTDLATTVHTADDNNPRVLVERRAKFAGTSGLVQGDRWFGTWRIREEHPDFVDDDGEQIDHQLPNGVNPAETTHCVMYDDATVAMISNQFGPSHAAIARYLTYRSGTRVRLAPLPDPEVVRQLDELDDLRKIVVAVDLSATPPIAGGAIDEELEDELGLTSLIERAEDEAHDSIEEVEVTMRWKDDERRETAGGLLDGVTNALAGLRQRFKVTKADVYGGADGRAMLPVHLLEQQVAARSDIDVPSVRRLTAEQAVGAIQQATGRIPGTLERARTDQDERAQTARDRALRAEKTTATAEPEQDVTAVGDAGSDSSGDDQE